MPVQFTPILGLPYPEPPDPPDVPKDIKALADKLDGVILPSAHPQVLQPGDLVVSAAAARAGCVLCDGTALVRATYPGLFAAIGVSFGAGDGSTTFNVPDYRGRTIVGAGAGPGLTTRNMGDKFGEESHALSIAEMPAHSHGVNDPTHAHGVSDGGHWHYAGNRFDFGVPQVGGVPVNWFASRDIAWGGNVGIENRGTGIGIYGAGTGISNQNTGASARHNVASPSGVANVFIKF